MISGLWPAPLALMLFPDVAIEVITSEECLIANGTDFGVSVGLHVVGSATR